MKKRIVLLFLVCFFICCFSGCVASTNEVNTMEYKSQKLIVDDEVIALNDDFRVIEPVWWSVSIYDGEKQYNNDLEQFSLPQRYVFAIEWYMAEVNNGGHDQFYYNSTGIVWEDAMKGFQEIGAQENYSIIRGSANAIGGNPNKDREKRQDEMEKYEPDFTELDERFYASESSMIEKLQAYIKENADSFYFNGEVKMPE